MFTASRDCGDISNPIMSIILFDFISFYKEINANDIVMNVNESKFQYSQCVAYSKDKPVLCNPSDGHVYRITILLRISDNDIAIQGYLINGANQYASLRSFHTELHIIKVIDYSSAELHSMMDKMYHEIFSSCNIFEYRVSHKALKLRSKL